MIFAPRLFASRMCLKATGWLEAGLAPAIISRSPSVFKGYYKDPMETAKALRDGWLYSGDTGFIDPDGHLVFFDRTKDVFILSDGSRFSPMFLESRLKFSPYIKDAWVLGNQRPFATAVICIDYSVVGKWAEDNHIAYTSYQELTQDPRVSTLIPFGVFPACHSS